MKCLETRWISGIKCCSVCSVPIYGSAVSLVHFPPDCIGAHHAACCGKSAPDPRAAEYLAASDDRGAAEMMTIYEGRNPTMMFCATT
jgi:hypothetical protein